VLEPAYDEVRQNQLDHEGEDKKLHLHDQSLQHSTQAAHLNFDRNLHDKILAQNHIEFKPPGPENMISATTDSQGNTIYGMYQPKPPKSARFFPVTDENLGSGLEGSSSNKNMLQKIEQQWGNLRKAFRAIDKDSSGTIDEKELGMLLDRFNIRDATAKEIMSKYDKDGNGSIDYHEFMDVFATKLVTPTGKKKAERAVRRLSMEERTDRKQNLTEAAKLVIELFKVKLQELGGTHALAKWFRAFDEDQNGQIKHEEFQRICEHFDMRLADETIRDVLQSFDVDHDGALEYDEFVEMVQDGEDQTGNFAGIADAAFERDAAGPPEDGEDDEDDFFARTRGRKVFELTDEDDKLAEDPVMNAARVARANHMVEKQMKELLRRGGKMKKLFRELDEDGNGQLSTEEFMKGMTKFMWQHGIHVRKEGMERLVSKVDADKNGRIQYTEFFDRLGFDTKEPDRVKDPRWKEFDGKALEAHQKGNPVGVKALNHLRTVLAKQGYDPSKLRPMMLAFRGTLALESVDDSVSRDEFKKAVCAVRELRLEDEEVERMIDCFDIDGDGEINFREFAATICPVHKGTFKPVHIVSLPEVPSSYWKNRLEQRTYKAPLRKLTSRGILAAVQTQTANRLRPPPSFKKPSFLREPPPHMPLPGKKGNPQTLRHMKSIDPWQTTSRCFSIGSPDVAPAETRPKDHFAHLKGQRMMARDTWEVNHEFNENKAAEKRQQTDEQSLRRFRKSRRFYAKQLLVHEKKADRSLKAIKTFPANRSMHIRQQHDIFAGPANWQ
jgi:Ca2+-binding EF-hand superfamily protein